MRKLEFCALLILAFAACFSGNIFGQTPGGLGPGILHAWLKADAGVGCVAPANNNCEVNTWADQSNKGNDAVSEAGTSINHMFGDMNFNPGVELSNNNYIAFPRPAAEDSMTIFMVFETQDDTNASNNDWWEHPALLGGEMSGAVQDYGLTLDDGDIHWSRDTSDEPVIDGSDVADGFNKIATVRRQSVDGACEMWVNAVSQGAAGTMITGALNSPDSLHIGGAPAGNLGGIDATIGEVVWYAGFMAGAERQRVHSYLALKYGITIPDNYVNYNGSTTVFDNQAGVYDNDVVGIGRDDSTSLYQRMSRPSDNDDGARIYNGIGFGGTFPTRNRVGAGQNPNTLEDGEYLVMGHNGAGTGWNSSFDVFASAKADRTFRVEETGDIGKVTLLFEDGDYDFTLGRLYHLVVSTDAATFNFSDEVIPLENIPGTENFYVEVDFPANSIRYISVVRMDAQFPRPGYVDLTVNDNTHWLDAGYMIACTGSPTCGLTTWYDIGNQTGGAPNGSVPNNVVEVVEGAMNYNDVVRTNPNGNVMMTRKEEADFTGLIVFQTTGAIGGNTNYETQSAILSSASNSGTFADEFGVTIRADGAITWTTSKNNAGGVDYMLEDDSEDFNDGAPHVVFFDKRILAGSHPMCLDVDGKNLQQLPTNNDQTLDDNPTMRIGRHVSDNGRLAGDFAELIMFDELVTLAQKEKLETYLALKYGITLGHNYYQTDATASGAVLYDIAGYGEEIIGIGSDIVSRLDQRVSSPGANTDALTLIYDQWTGGLPGRNKDVLCGVPEGTFVVAGHDGGSINFNSAFSGVPATRMDRVYKVTETGAVDDITLFFSGSEYTTLAAATSYNLIVSSDIMFDGSDMVIPMVNSSGSDYYVTLDLPTGTSFISIAQEGNLGPGGIRNRLQLWVRGDQNFTDGNAAVSTWGDISGLPVNDLVTLNNAGFPNPDTTLVNYNVGVSIPQSLDSQFASVNPIPAVSIFAVGKATNPLNTGDAYFMGYSGAGLIGPAVASGPAVDSAATASFLGPPGKLYQNSASIDGEAIVENWSVISAHRDSNAGPFNGTFFLGAPGSRASMATYDFAEVIVYDSAISVSNQQRVESYLAIRYGITLTEDYLASDGSTAYGLTAGFANDIAIVGRDDASSLNQKQSKSVNPDGIVAIGIGTVETANDINANNLPDLEFIGIGNDDGSNCWTTVEVGSLAGKYWRMGRKWRISSTAGYADDLTIQMDINNTGFPLPALPAGSGGNYILLRDADGDFSAGAVIDAFTSTTANHMTAILTNAEYTATPYFSIAVQLDSTNWGLVDLCNADTVGFFGSFLDDTSACTRLVFDDGVQPFELYPSDVILTADGGDCIDKWLWTTDDTYASYGIYEVSVETGPNSNPCDATNTYSPTNLVVARDSLTIGLNGSTSFTYPAAGPICVGDPNLVPDTTTLSRPGIFYLDSTTALGVNDQNLFTSVDSGVVLIYPATAGTHVICYTLPGNCAGPDNCETITINPAQNSVLTYPLYTACQSDTAQMIPSAFPSAGVFVSTPTLNNPTFSSTGRIVPANEAPGTYFIEYTPPPGGCAPPVSRTIVISAVDTAQFGYPSPIVCLNGSNPVPSVFSLPGPGTYGCGNCGGMNTLNFNGPNGEIDLATSTAGIYLVEYQITGACQDTGRTTVELVDPPIISQFLLDTTYCQGSGSPIVTVNPNMLGQSLMEDLSGSVAFQVQGNGNWRIQTNGASVGGPYPIRYTYTDNNGCVGSQTKLTSIIGADSTTVSYPTDVYCLGDPQPNPTPVFSQGLGGGTFAATPLGTYCNPSTGEIDLAQVPVGVAVSISYDNTVGTCPSIISVGPGPITFYDNPDPSFFVGTFGTVETLCQGSSNLTGTATGDGLNMQVFVGDSMLGVLPGANIPSSNFTGDTTYTIYNIVLDTASGCRDTALDYIAIVNLDVVDFWYEDTLCSGTGFPDPLPSHLGTGGGTYSSTSAIVDATTGQLDLDSTQVVNGDTSHFVVYATNGVCPTTDSVQVYILPAIDASFQYLTSIVCNDVGFLDVNSQATPGGVFTCLNCPNQTGNSAFVNSTTGRVNFQNISVDTTLQIQHSFVSAGFCGQNVVEEIKVEAFKTVSISYPTDTFCQVGSTTPLILGVDLVEQGVFLPRPGIAFLDVDSGVVNLQSTSTGPHTIEYVLGGVCAERATYNIFIRPTVTGDFFYPITSICDGQASSIAPVLIDTSSLGTFEAVGQTGSTTLSIGTFSGVIDLLASDVGNYTVTHVTNGFCRDTVERIFSISALPDIGDLFVDPSSTICGEDTIEVRINAGGFPVLIVDSIPNPGVSSLVIPNPGDGLVITGIITNTDGCADTASITIVRNEVPLIDVTTWPNTISGDEEIQLVLEALTDNTQIIWEATSSPGVTLEFLGDTTDFIDAGQLFEILNNVELDSDFYPGSMEYQILPVSDQGCLGDTLILPININPNNEMIFIPGVFTPNGDNQNDTWQIQWRSDIEPESHTIELYNRTGGKVFTMEGLTDTWTGDNLPDGVYWYLVKDPAGESIMAGGLTIRRR